MPLPALFTRIRSPRLTQVSNIFVGRAIAFRHDVAATTSIEYVLLGSLIAVTIAGICGMMFSKLSTEYVEIGNIFS